MEMVPRRPTAAYRQAASSTSGSRPFGSTSPARCAGLWAVRPRPHADGRPVAYLGGAFFTTWRFFTTAVDGISDPNAAPIVDAQVAN
ncbi:MULTISPECIES: hypothetical protein [unclassified Solwaraspora]|uniref:hypothetical protein n=1 Tax=unclassified Solwaraspora TaxID=2627926 RepID=UPI00248C708B|nr:MULTISPECIES: hypothetical protein [unclassified Solwaraspora]WBB96720.1 hypothetical protein O7553_26070 [Solwaraspora sp. WMMA2059]WBC19376.1 hypothetical protein O7543_21300 [Solwaraspora sp. WMMA2080]WJK33181.1 hypothetical protein O7610_21035 [Solwaraspora sp. WMMA2065]